MGYSVAMLSVHTSPLDVPAQTKDAGGMNVYIRELARELGQQHISIDIFTRRTNQDLPQVVHLYPQVRVIHIQAGSPSPISKHDLFQHLPAFTAGIEEFRQCEARAYDLLHSHYWLSGMAAVELARQWHIPHVTMFHTLERLKQRAHLQQPISPLRLEMEQWLIQQVDGIIASTSDERQQLIRYCAARPSQVEVIPCGVDLQLFTPYDRQQARQRLNLLQDQPMLLFVGRLDPFKGPDLFFQSAAIMQEDAQIVIVGGNLTGKREDHDVMKLRQLAADLDISQRVYFLGARPQQDLPLIYSAADVTVVPSYHESFGLAAIESLACGTPVVATHAGGLTTVVRHGTTGYLVPRSPDFFAQKLDTLLQCPELLAQMRLAARPSIVHFNWGNVAHRVSSVYHTVSGRITCLAAQH